MFRHRSIIKRTNILKEKLNLIEVDSKNFFDVAPVDKKTIFEKSRLVDLVQWRSIYYCVVLIETQNFTRTSEICNSERTTIINAINKLEDALDIKDKYVLSKINLVRNNAKILIPKIKCKSISINSIRPMVQEHI